MARRWLYSYHLILAAFGVVSVGCVVAAGLLDPDGSFVYFGLLDLGIGAATMLLTVVLIERVLDHRRAREREEHWKEVREHSVASLWLSMGHIAGLAYAGLLTRPERESPDHLQVIEQVAAGCERPVAGTAAAIADLAGLLRAGTLPPGGGLTRRVRWWTRRATRHLDHIREAIIPRLLQATDDHELNRLLMRLDRLGYALQGRLGLAALGVGRTDRLIGTREAVADLLVEYANVALHLEANYLTDAMPGEDVQTQPVVPVPVTFDGPTASRPSNVVE
jgi:hypothetical protein